MILLEHIKTYFINYHMYKFCMDVLNELVYFNDLFAEDIFVVVLWFYSEIEHVRFRYVLIRQFWKILAFVLLKHCSSPADAVWK